MAKLLDQRGAIILLRQEGWRLTTGGKHVVKMVRSGERPITLPRHRGQAYGKDLTNAIIKQAGLESTEGRAWSSRSSHAKKESVTGRRSESFRAASRPLER